MSNTKHTPGPWVIHPHVDIEYAIFNQTGTTHIADVTTEANAKLMAAAPDLYEAVDQLLSRIVVTDTWDKKAVLVAKAALRKATE